MRIGWRGMLLAVLVSAMAANTGAQALYGSLLGNVTDETGAALPGATVTITQRETNLARDIVTNETGSYNVPNLLPGTYQIDVKLQGFSTFTARDIAVRQGLDVRVDAQAGRRRARGIDRRLGAGGRAADRKRRCAVAHDGHATGDGADQRPRVADRPRADARCGAAQLRSVRRQQQPDPRDGHHGQRPAAEQHRRPARRRVADQPVLPADSGLQPEPRGDRNGQRRHQQLRRRSGDGGRRVGERAGQERHEHDRRIAVRTCHRLPDEVEELLPAGRRSRRAPAACTSTAARSGGPIRRNKMFFFASVERTRQRTEAGNAFSNSGANGLRSLPTMAMREGNFAGTGTVLYDPRTGTATGTGRMPFAFANCPGHQRRPPDPQFDACNFIPANRINPIAKNFLSKLVAPSLPGFTNNFFATNSYDTDYNKYDGKITWTPSARVIVNGRLGYGDSYEDSAPEMPSIDGGVNPDFPGAHLGFDGAQPLAGGHLHAVAHDGDGRRVRVYAHRHAGPPAHGRLLGRAARRQEQLPAAAFAAARRFRKSWPPTLSSGRRRRAARLPRSAVERVDELRVDEGRPQREVRRRDEDPPPEPLRNADADVLIQWRADGARAGRAEPASTRLRTSCWARCTRARRNR